MKFVKIKEKFVEKACSIDKEFLQKAERGYGIIIIYKKESWLIPLRSNCRHSNCFKNERTNKYLDYTKSFKLINNNIIDSNFHLNYKEFEYYERNVKIIAQEFENFQKKRKYIDKCVDVNKIEKIQ